MMFDLTDNTAMPQRVAPPTTTAVPSIEGSALLAELTISVWTGRKLDKSASNDVTRSNNAYAGMANVHKKLLGDCKELDAVRKFAAQIRQLHYATTMPWSDSGLRLLPTANFFKYTEGMNKHEAEFNRLVQAFLDAYDWEISRAQVKLGALFSPDDYPTTHSLRNKFGMGVAFVPLPSTNDWRVDIGHEAQTQLQAQYQKYYEEQLAKAMRDVWERATKTLTRMSTMLDYGADERPTGFRDTLVDDALEMVDVLESCNLTGDPDMTETARRLRLAISGIDADDLRQDPALRSRTKRSVDEMIKNLPGLGM